MVEDISDPLKVMRRESIRIGRKYRRFTVAGKASIVAVAGVATLIHAGLMKGAVMGGDSWTFAYGLTSPFTIGGAFVGVANEYLKYDWEHGYTHILMENLQKSVVFLRKVEEGKIQAASGYKARIFDIAKRGNDLVSEFIDIKKRSEKIRKGAEQNLVLVNKQFHERRNKVSHEIQRLKKVPGKESDKKIKELKKGLWKLVKNHMRVQKQLEKTEKKTKAVIDRVDDIQNSLNLIARMNKRLMAGMNHPVKGES